MKKKNWPEIQMFFSMFMPDAKANRTLGKATDNPVIKYSCV